MSTPWIIDTPMTNLPKSLQKQGLLGANLAHVTPLLGLSANPTPSWQVPPRNCFNGLAQGNPILTNKSLTWISVRLLSSLFGAPEQPEIYKETNDLGLILMVKHLMPRPQRDLGAFPRISKAICFKRWCPASAKSVILRSPQPQTKDYIYIIIHCWHICIIIIYNLHIYMYVRRFFGGGTFQHNL